MALIFLSFANDAAHPLPTLTREDEEVYRLLSSRSAKGHFSLHRDSNASLAKVAEYIIRFKDDLTVFLFSGHADRDHLLMDGQTVQGNGIAALLGECPRLKVIVLNGCSTVGQVQELLELPNQPAVIATSAPVNDYTATQFSISFFQALSEQYAPLQEAFNIGLAAAKAAEGQPLAIPTPRQPMSGEAPSAPIWLLDTAPEARDKLEWKLPSLISPSAPSDIQPNQYLLKGLLHSLAAFDSNAKEVMENKRGTVEVRGRRRLKKGDNERRNVILKCLPLPISEQIEKLVTKRRENNHVFYDSFSYDRLRQLLLTYDTAMELPAFLLLAQLFDLLADEQRAVAMTPEQVEVVAAFLKAPYPERLKKINFPLIRTIIAVLGKNEVPLFVPELADLQGELEADFRNAFHGLEVKKKRLPQMRTLEDGAMRQECIEAEEMLTLVLGKFSFLASYSLVSVRNIDVLRNRLFRTPSFVHRVIHLAKKDSGEPEEIEELLDDFLDNESVLLMKKQALSGQASFLNLAPFVIDENAYVEKAEKIKLNFFHHFQESSKAYYYKHTYKPEDPLLEILGKEEETEAAEVAFQDVWDQFEDFRKLLQTAAQ